MSNSYATVVSMMQKRFSNVGLATPRRTNSTAMLRPMAAKMLLVEPVAVVAQRFSPGTQLQKVARGFVQPGTASRQVKAHFRTSLPVLLWLWV
jgi:hypothetical protein